MHWPAGGISTADLDSGADSPGAARAAILQDVQQFNDLAAMLGVPLGADSLDSGGGAHPHVQPTIVITYIIKT